MLVLRQWLPGRSTLRLAFNTCESSLSMVQSALSWAVEDARHGQSSEELRNLFNRFSGDLWPVRRTQRWIWEHVLNV